MTSYNDRSFPDLSKVLRGQILYKNELNRSIKKQQKTITQYYQELGQKYYEHLVKKTMDCEELDNWVAKIRLAEYDLEELMMKKRRLEGVRTCPKCDFEVDSKAKFCPSCGFQFPKEDANSYICRQCGMKFRVADLYCPRCGTKAEEIRESVCPSCGSRINGDQLYCDMCGTKVSGFDDKYANNSDTEYCPVCGSKIKTGFMFCTKCGFSFINGTNQ